MDRGPGPLDAGGAEGSGSVADLGDGGSHGGGIDLVNVDRLADGGDHRQGQAAAEVLAELFEAEEQVVRLVEGRVIEREAQIGQAAEDAVGYCRIKTQGDR